MDRRGFLSGAVACLLPAAVLARELEGEADDWAPLPAGLDPTTVPGLSWNGSGPAVIEIFDYNCGYCRAAFQALDRRLRKPGALRLGLIDSPQLSLGSIQAAKLRQAVLRLYGPDKAIAFHRKLFSRRGEIGAEAGLAATKELGLDVARVTEEADSDAVRDVLIAQARFLNRAGVQATPSFIVGGRILQGWPGAAGLDAILQPEREK